MRVRSLAGAGLLCLLLPMIARGQSSEIRVLSYNVHGLASWLVDDEPERRMPEISQRLDRYDVALLQEDWVHHDELLSAASHEVVELGNAPRDAWFRGLQGTPSGSGSGLTTLVRAPRERILAVQRLAYGSCSGWLFGASDCFGDKGTLLVRVRFGREGAVDFWNTHLEAGREAEDRVVRRSQLELLRTRIGSVSAGRAVVLAGDLNLNDADPEVHDLLAAFRQALGLVDAGIVPGEPWNHIDYVMYRSAPSTRLLLLEAGEDTGFATPDGPLSDHPAIFARFRVTQPE